MSSNGFHDQHGELELFVGPPSGRRRLVIVNLDGRELLRDEINTNSEPARRRWIRDLEARLQAESGDLEHLIPDLLQRADEADRQSGSTQSQSRRALSQADLLVQLAEPMELFHDPERKGHVSFSRNGHRETWPLRKKEVKQYLAHLYHREHQKVPNSQAMQDALGVLEGRALYQGPEHPVYLRYAWHEDDIYIDLCNEHWQAVRISAAGYEVVDNPPVRFRRVKGMLPLPRPEAGGELIDLAEFVNVSAASLVLLLAYLVASINPRGPYFVLILTGEQGTAKSTLARVVVALVDPSRVPLRAEPHNLKDLMIAANNHWLLVFDNLSQVKGWFSDACALLATGGGMSTRQLYTDDDEMLFDAQRPIVMTGIGDIVDSSDLLERSIILPLEPIPASQRRTEADYWAEFERAKPRLLGALYSALAAALRNQHRIQLEQLPRMADAARWAVAAESGMGVPAGAFLQAYSDNQRASHEMALEAAPIASVIQEFITAAPGRQWTGTATDLLAELPVPDRLSRQSGWPRSPQALATALRRIVPDLRARGIFVEFRHSGHRTIEIRMAPGVQGAQGVQGVQPCSESDSGASPNEGSTQAGLDALDTSDAGNPVPSADAMSDRDSLDTADALDAGLQSENADWEETL